MYDDILRWAEKNFPIIGREIFKYVALQPASLVMPSIPSREQNIRPQIHVLILTPPGAFKSTLCRSFAALIPAYNPYLVKRRTAAKIQEELEGMNHASIIIEDLARMMHEQSVVKVLEGMLEEGEVNDASMRNEYKYQIKLTGTFMGVPQDLSSAMTSGFLGRVTPRMITLTEEEQDEIADYLAKGVGQRTEGDAKEAIAKKYQNLYDLQNRKETKITGYVISHKIQDSVYQAWVNIRKQLAENGNGQINNLQLRMTSWFREFGEGIRFVCALAIMNREKRRIVEKPEGLLIEPNDEDLNRGINLMEINIVNKHYMLLMEQFQRKNITLKSIDRQNKKIRIMEEKLKEEEEAY